MDSAGNAYVTGASSSTNFPTMNPLQPAYGGGDDDAFVTKINESGSALVYSTYLGGAGQTSPKALPWTARGTLTLRVEPTQPAFHAANTVQPAYGGGEDDASVTEFNPTGSALIFSAYLGGSGTDESQGVAVDSSGNAYVTGSTSSNNFPRRIPCSPPSPARTTPS